MSATVAALLVFAVSGVVLATVDLGGTFETGNLSQFPHVQINPGNSITVIESPVRSGKYAARFEANLSGKAKDWRRAEVVEPYSPALPVGKRDRWYGGSFRLPDDYQFDPDQAVIIFQMHENDNVSHPVFSLSIKGDMLNNHVRLKKNRWYDFVMHARWSNETDGFTEYSINGIKVEGKYNLVTSQLLDGQPPYAKWGIYKHDWRSKPLQSKVNQVAILWDNCRVATTEAEVDAPEPEVVKGARR